MSKEWPGFLIFADTSNTKGAPSFAQFAKGGSVREFVPKIKASRVSSIATRPCKRRKDGAPLVLELQAV